MSDFLTLVFLILFVTAIVASTFKRKSVSRNKKVYLWISVIVSTMLVGITAPDLPENSKPEKVTSAEEEKKPDKPKHSIIEAKIGQEMKFGSCSVILEGFAVYASTEAQQKDTDHWVKLGGYYINSFWIAPEKCWSDEYFEVKVNQNGLTAWRNWNNNNGLYTHYLGKLWDGNTRIDVIGKNKTYRYNLKGDWDSIKKGSK